VAARQRQELNGGSGSTVAAVQRWWQRGSGGSMVAMAAAGGSSASALQTRGKSISVFDYVLLGKWCLLILCCSKIVKMWFGAIFALYNFVLL
jgi:hypothetical protein